MRWLWLIVALVVAGCASSRTPTEEPTIDRPATERPATERSSYGDHADQYVVVHRPSGEPVRPTVVLLHGGFWLERYRADLMTPLAEDLAQRGYLVVNVEYRRVGGAGGWPATFLDVAAAMDHLVELADVPTDHVVTVGHSAGGHLAVWAASRHRLPDGAAGGGPRLRPCGAIAQAGMVDLVASADAGLGKGAVGDLVGGTPQQVPDRYAVADPTSLLPIGVPVVLIHGEDDRIVPVGISRSYVERAAAVSDPVQLVTLPGGHFEAIDPAHPLWLAVVERLGSVCPQ